MTSSHYYNRKRPVHPSPLPLNNRSVILFVTVCTDKRKRILDRADSVAAILNGWRLAGAWMVGRYVIMPDHVHFFCAPREPDVPFKKWMGFWKSRVACMWPRQSEVPVWQQNSWDSQLRRGESYSAKWDYVYRNPVRAGLVERPEDWAYAGEMNVLAWRDA